MTANSDGSVKTKHLAPYQFRPGQSGNPNGRPKRAPISDVLRGAVIRKIPESMREKLPSVLFEVFGPEPTFGDLLALQMISQAAKGDVRAFAVIMDRIEGKVSAQAENEREVLTKVLVNL